ncbi:MAG: type II CAAX endopeptidase family protein [Candidatus Micrarchaeota archaeon]|nr:type II CAAX endopeptidase family protein [Candidatus Micrarchaeota archaeon]
MQKERVLRLLILILSFGSLSTIASLIIIANLPPVVSVATIFIFLTSLIAGITKRYGKIACLWAALSYLLFVVFATHVAYATSIILSFSLLVFPFFWNMEVKRASLGKTLNSFGIKRDKLWWNVAFGLLATAFILYPLTGLEKVTIVYLGFDTPDVVADVIKSLPLYMAIFTFTFTPFAEEIFFRGFLLDRIGIVLSSLLFAMAHFTYGSVAEFAVAFTAGLAFAVMKRRSGSLVPAITAHALFNFVTVLIFYVVGANL